MHREKLETSPFGLLTDGGFDLVEFNGMNFSQAGGY
jgi:hypothetical protein